MTDDRPRALDLATGVGAAAATRHLADLGWDVVKVEPPGGDRLRTTPSRWGGGAGGAFAAVNVGKRGVVCGADAVVALAAAADVVVADLSPAGRAAAGLPDDVADRLAPRAALVSLSPFGLRGPRATWAASDLVLQAASGLMFLTGEWDQPPQQLPPYQAALSAGVAAAAAVLAAARAHRRHGGPARRLDLAMVEAMATFTPMETTRYLTTGEVARREARVKQALRMAPTSDGYVYCAPGAVATARMDGVAELVGEPRLAEERFQTAAGRMRHWDEFCALFVPPFATRTAREWFERAEALHLTFALVQTVDDLLGCPHLADRGFLRQVPAPAGPTIAVPGRAFRLGGAGGRPPSPLPAPAVPGQHTDEVLAEWLG